MHKLFAATIALAGVLGLVPLTASAAPAPLSVAPQATPGTLVQQVDWDHDYCGPRCRYLRHRHWEHERAERRREWRREHYGWNNHRDWR